MASQYFNQVDIAIGGTGVLAESAAINSENAIEPQYIVGRIGLANQSPQGPQRTQFNFNYLLNVAYEPSLSGVFQLKNLSNQNLYSGVRIEIAGITGYDCYLDNYSMTIATNDVAQVNASYTSYLPTSGIVRAKTGILYTGTNLAHAWTTFITTSGTFRPIYDFNYSFQANWAPVYKQGQQKPAQVSLMGAQENFVFTREEFNNIHFTGLNVTGILSTGDFNMDFYSVNILCDSTSPYFNLNLSGAKVKNEQLDIALDDFVKIKTSAQKFF